MKYLIGVGNYSQFDDSVGIRVVEYVEEKGLNKGFELLDLSHNSLNLFSYLTDETERILIVDCAKMGLNPGEYKFFTPDQVVSRKEIGNISSHEGDMLKTIELAEQTGYPIPEVEFMGIEPKTFEGQMGISPELGDKIPTYAEEAIKRLLK